MLRICVHLVKVIIQELACPNTLGMAQDMCTGEIICRLEYLECFANGMENSPKCQEPILDEDNRCQRLMVYS